MLVSHSVITDDDAQKILKYKDMPDNKDNILYNPEMLHPLEVFDTFYWDNTEEDFTYWNNVQHATQQSFVTNAIALMGNLYANVLDITDTMTKDCARAYCKNNGIEYVDDIEFATACHLIYLVEDYEIDIFKRIYPTDIFVIQQALAIVELKINENVVD